MKYLAVLLALSLLSTFYSFNNTRLKEKPRVLVFTKTTGWHHTSIPAGQAAIMKLGAENNFDVDTTADAGWFTDDNLKKYAAIVFLSTTGELFDSSQKLALQHFIHAGKGYMGIHAATDAEYNWPWYNKLAGAYFDSHPEQQNATLDIVDRNNGSTKHLPAKWTRWDEWYNFKQFNKDDVQVLITIDESSYKGGKMNGYHPMAWYHAFEGGRAFYTELGHTDEAYSDPMYLKHILGGIEYAIGIN